MIMHSLGAVVKVRVIWRTDKREECLTKGMTECCFRWKRISDERGQDNACLPMQGSTGEWSEEPRQMGCLASELLSLGKTVFSRVCLLFNYPCPRFYWNQLGDCTHFFVSLEIRLSWNRWLGKSLFYTENIVAVTIVALQACWKGVRQRRGGTVTPVSAVQ